MSGVAGRTVFSALKRRSSRCHSRPDAARAYGRVFAAVTAAGQRTRGTRAVDLLIAAVALSAGLPLYTRNGDDFQALDHLIDVIVI